MTAEAELEQVERRGWRGQALALPAIALFFAAVTVLRGNHFAFWDGAAAWTAVGALTAAFGALLLITRSVPALRARQVTADRTQHALRTHTDPGLELRSQTDSQAQLMSGQGWAAWLTPFVVMGLVLDARWDRAVTTVPAALVIVGLVTAYIVYWRRLTSAARRWVEDPPGPSRRLSPGGDGGGRRTLVLFLVVAAGLVLAAIGLALALLP